MKPWKNIASLDDALQVGLTEHEFSHIVKLISREPSILELGIFSALYSEHCSYKSSKFHLKTLPVEGTRVVQGPGENAGVIDIGDNQVVVFKIESHNHPSFIEPFQGAATGVGGILRDVFTMGARPLVLMNALRFGHPQNPITKSLFTRAVAGIGSYGNCVGIPTIGGELFFHEAYNSNCLVNAFALGVADKDSIFLGSMGGVGNTILYVGSKTGRDGIHGATMASEAFDDDSQEKRPTVQVGDPFQEKLLLEACLEAMQTGAVVGIQDMGAAGLTSSTYEMADRGGVGVRLYLDKVPLREEGMNPYEIMLSESQERMLLVVAKGQEKVVLNIFHRWEIDGVVIGEVKEGDEVELMWEGECISSLKASLVSNSTPQCHWPENIPKENETRLNFEVSSIAEPEDLESSWYTLLNSANLCSRADVYRQYDSTVRSNTVIHPGGDAAVIRIKDERSTVEKGIACTLDCNSRYCALDPRQGTALSVTEAYRNIISVGAEPIGISNCLNFGSPERPEGMWQLAEAIRGLGEAARAFGIPVVSGNVSLYNETKGKAILPTPVIAMVGLIRDVDSCIPIYFRKPGHKILVFGETREKDLGGSEFLAYIGGVEKGALPLLDYDLEKKSGNFILELIKEELIISCHDISGGGLGIALSECCFSPYKILGARIERESKNREHEGKLKHGFLFAESGARYIVSCEPEKEKKVRALAQKTGIPVSLSGVVGGESIEIMGYAGISLGKGYDMWKSGLKVFFE